MCAIKLVIPGENFLRGDDAEEMNEDDDDENDEDGDEGG